MSLRQFIRPWRAAKTEPLWQRAVDHVLETPDPIGWNTWAPAQVAFLAPGWQMVAETCTAQQTADWFARHAR